MLLDVVRSRAWKLVVLAGLAVALALASPDSTAATSLNEVKKLRASDAEAGDLFGLSVAVSGDSAVVGALKPDFPVTNPGAAYVFQRDQGGADNWGEVVKLTASDAGAGDLFGVNVAVSGGTAVVGALHEDAGGSEAGAAYVFQRDEGGADNWGEVTKLTASDAQAGDNFGNSVAVSGDTAVVAAFLEDAGGSEPGAAYVFQRNEGGADNWGEVKKLTASDAEAGDLFGRSVAVSGDTAVVGAYQEDSGGVAAGAAYVFDLLPKPTPTTTPTATPTPTKQPDPGDTDGDGCSDQRENGPDETLGGLRDYKNPNDFYDVAGAGGGPKDQIIDLPNDILGVIQHYAPLGTEPTYDVNFDRGPRLTGPVWNMTAPDGVIDLPNDILGVIRQFNHSCQ